MGTSPSPEQNKAAAAFDAARGPDSPRPKRRGWAWVVMLGVAALGIWYYHGVSTKREAAAAAAAKKSAAARGVPVVVATARKGDMPVYLRGLGTVIAFNTVTVRSRVDGQLINVAFKEGQFVHQGELLAQIDPRPFQVQLEQAEGQLAHDVAQLTNAQLDLGRYTKLYEEQVLAKQQVDGQQALVAQLGGAIKSDQAQIDNAKLQLAYAHITAPINGRIGLRLVDPGNLVHATDPNGMLVITQLQPIAVVFSLPQDDLQEVYKKLRAGERLTVEVYSQDNVTKLSTGTLLTIDNQIDPTTGTYKLKAVFNNEDNILFPNQFVNVRLLVGHKTGLTLVPAPAVQSGPQGNFVYAVTPAGTAAARPVSVAITEANVAGISNGLQPGDVVVTDGQDKLQDGTRVDAHPAAPPQPGTNAAK